MNFSDIVFKDLEAKLLIEIREILKMYFNDDVKPHFEVCLLMASIGLSNPEHNLDINNFSKDLTADEDTFSIPRTVINVEGEYKDELIFLMKYITFYKMQSIYNDTDYQAINVDIKDFKQFVIMGALHFFNEFKSEDIKNDLRMLFTLFINTNNKVLKLNDISKVNSDQSLSEYHQLLERQSNLEILLDRVNLDLRKYEDMDNND